MRNEIMRKKKRERERERSRVKRRRNLRQRDEANEERKIKEGSLVDK